MRLAVLSNAAFDDAVHSDVMAPPFEGRLSAMPNATLVRPEPLRRPTFRAAAPAWLSAIRVIRRADTLFWVQMSARPPWQLAAIGALRPSARRSAWTTDAWLPSLLKIGRAAAIQRLSPLFVSQVQAVEGLRRRFPRGRFHHLPAAANVELFRERGYERDIFAFWMGAGGCAMSGVCIRRARPASWPPAVGTSSSSLRPWSTRREAAVGERVG
jgi:hypothetical protein